MENRNEAFFFLYLFPLLWSQIAGTEWICGVTVCREGVHFCHRFHGPPTCYKCEDFEKMCFSSQHEPNCTLWCKDNLEQKLKQKFLETTCGPLLGVQNGVHNSTNATIHKIDEVVTFTCNQGFERVGPESITCMGFGQWSSHPPSCQETTCGPLLGVQNGVHNSTNATIHRIDEVVTFTCHQGFERVGPESITCMGFGQWSSHPPFCQGRAPNPTTLLIVLCVFAALFIAILLTLLCMCFIDRKRRAVVQKTAGTTEAALLFAEGFEDSQGKDERFSLIGDDKSSDESDEDREQTYRKRSNTSASEPANTAEPKVPEPRPVFNSSVTIINQFSPDAKISVTKDKNDEKPEPKDTIQAVQESGLPPAKQSAAKPLLPRQPELCQPDADDIGEKGLSPSLPSGAKELSARLSIHQPEEQTSPNKIALEGQVIDQQDLGDMER